MFVFVSEDADYKEKEVKKIEIQKSIVDSTSGRIIWWGGGESLALENHFSGDKPTLLDSPHSLVLDFFSSVPVFLISFQTSCSWTEVEIIWQIYAHSLSFSLSHAHTCTHFPVLALHLQVSLVDNLCCIKGNV